MKKKNAKQAKADDQKQIRAFFIQAVQSRAQAVLYALHAVGQAPSIRTTHRLATNLRRLLSTDFAVRKLYGKRLLPKPARQNLRIFRSALGTLRDVQEVRRKWDSLNCDTAFYRAFAGHLADEETKGRAEIRTATQTLDAAMFEQLADVTYLSKLFQNQSRCPINAFWNSLRQDVLVQFRKLLHENQGEILHHMRVQFKCYRYVTELFAPAMIPAEKKALADCKAMQDVLGKAHDWFVLHEQVMAFAEAHSRVSNKSVLSMVCRIRDETHQEAHDYAVKHMMQVLFLDPGQNAPNAL